MAEVKLCSQEGDVITTSFDAAQVSTLIMNIFEQGNNEQIPLPNIKTNILRKIVNWMEYHVDVPVWVPNYPIEEATLKMKQSMPIRQGNGGFR